MIVLFLLLSIDNAMLQLRIYAFEPTFFKMKPIQLVYGLINISLNYIILLRTFVSMFIGNSLRHHC